MATCCGKHNLCYRKKDEERKKLSSVCEKFETEKKTTQKKSEGRKQFYGWWEQIHFTMLMTFGR